MASIGGGISAADLGARVELGMAPEDWKRKHVSEELARSRSKYSHASELDTLAGLKPAVAVGGIDCETVVLADWPTARVTRAEVKKRVDSILTITQVVERGLKLWT